MYVLDTAILAISESGRAGLVAWNGTLWPEPSPGSVWSSSSQPIGAPEAAIRTTQTMPVLSATGPELVTVPVAPRWCSASAWRIVSAGVVSVWTIAGTSFEEMCHRGLGVATRNRVTLRCYFPYFYNP